MMLYTYQYPSISFDQFGVAKVTYTTSTYSIEEDQQGTQEQYQIINRGMKYATSRY